MEVKVHVEKFQTLGYGRALVDEKHVKVHLINGDKSLVVWEANTANGFCPYHYFDIEEEARKFARKLEEVCK